MKKQEIKAIIFDIGGILYKEYAGEFHKKIAKVFNINNKKLDKIRDKYAKQAHLGKLSQEKYLTLIAKDMKIKETSIFINTWKKLEEKEVKMKKDVKKTIKKLSRNYLIVAFTNTTKNHEKIRKKKKIYQYFKLKLSSTKEKLAKPEQKFYKLLLKKVKLATSEIIFIDDEKINLIPAKKLGINTILFKNNKQLIKDLKKQGVKI